MKMIRPISAILLAFLVLVSSTSFMVRVHFCMGQVHSVAMFTKAESCEKDKSLPPCHRDMKPACCQDETVVHEGDDFAKTFHQIHVVTPTPVDIEQPLILISETIPTSPLSRTEYFNYDPPLRSADLTVEHHVFLI
jgi:hypothetical protein